MKSLKIFAWAGLLIIGLVFIFAPGYLESQTNVVKPVASPKVTDAARALHSDLMVGDWHADSALWNRDLSELFDRGHVDIPRLQQGNVALQMFTTVTKSPRGQNYEHNKSDADDNITVVAVLQLWPTATWSSLAERALYQAKKITDLALYDSQNFKLVKSQKDLNELLSARQTNSTLVGGLIGTEGSHALDGDLNNISRLYEAGFRMMSLQHFFDNKLGGSLHGESQQGLTEFGRDAFLKMQQLDIIVDVSHSSEQTVRDVLALSTKPLVVSHTGLKGHCDSPRNISDSLMQQIAQAGGIIAVGFWEGAVCGTSPETIAKAMMYGLNLVGEDHVSLGSDYDGGVETSFDASQMVVLTQALMNEGATEIQIRKLMGGNMIRFLQQNLPKE